MDQILHLRFFPQTRKRELKFSASIKTGANEEISIVHRKSIPVATLDEIKSGLLNAFRNFQHDYTPETSKIAYRSLASSSKAAFGLLVATLNAIPKSGDLLSGEVFRQALLDFTKDAGRQITVTAYGKHFLPVELLYILPLERDTPPQLDGFLGYRACIDYNLDSLLRGAYEELPHDVNIYKNKSEFIGFVGAQLREAKREGDALETLFISNRIAAVVKEATCEEDVLDYWKTPNQTDIAHFMCHLRRDTDPDGSARLLLANSFPFDPFTLNQIDQASALKPLVFINACKSIDFRSYSEIDGFVKHFYPRYSRGLIASFIDVFDHAAAYFAISFYSQFLKGYTLSESLFNARLEAKRNKSIVFALTTLVYTLVCIEPRTRVLEGSM
jgi:hypothetical protein